MAVGDVAHIIVWLIHCRWRILSGMWPVLECSLCLWWLPEFPVWWLGLASSRVIPGEGWAGTLWIGFTWLDNLLDNISLIPEGDVCWGAVTEQINGLVQDCSISSDRKDRWLSARLQYLHWRYCSLALNHRYQISVVPGGFYAQATTVLFKVIKNLLDDLVLVEFIHRYPFFKGLY